MATVTDYNQLTMGISPQKLTCELNTVQTKGRYTFTGTCIKDAADQFEVELSFAIDADKQPPTLSGNYTIRRSGGRQEEGKLTGLFLGSQWSLNPANFENDETWYLNRK